MDQDHATSLCTLDNQYHHRHIDHNQHHHHHHHHDDDHHHNLVRLNMLIKYAFHGQLCALSLKYNLSQQIDNEDEYDDNDDIDDDDYDDDGDGSSVQCT